MFSTALVVNICYSYTTAPTFDLDFMYDNIYKKIFVSIIVLYNHYSYIFRKNISFLDL